MGPPTTTRAIGNWTIGVQIEHLMGAVGAQAIPTERGCDQNFISRPHLLKDKADEEFSHGYGYNGNK